VNLNFLIFDSFKLYLLRLVTVINETVIAHAKNVYFFYNMFYVLVEARKH